MIERLLEWDYYAFGWVNNGLANPFFDAVMPALRNAWFWAPVYVFFAVFLVHNYKRKGLYVVLGAVLAFVLADQISAHFLKDRLGRLRPCRDPELAGYIRLLVPCGSGKSLPSTHATNHFSISVFLISMLPTRRMRWLVPGALGWAALVCFAQVYVGVHFPVDVIFGAILGSAIGLLTAALVRSMNVTLDAPMVREKVFSDEERVE